MVHDKPPIGGNVGRINHHFSTTLDRARGRDLAAARKAPPV
ncbi:MAG: hypothetical protein OZSIB_2340 [Candidatus Ozemobacter sibiricus]|uniref:Uncharacterized protein n=1 Tax=Candidatus Ozemobacter sibiricus TaxID=2268124 RepID=A0A367ZS51_9BACT|nr:MAG: hypothetical protein OZSIB_2340 [Candidatus Ozemobacter sibiricus]